MTLRKSLTISSFSENSISSRAVFNSPETCHPTVAAAAVEWSPQFMLYSAFVRPEGFCVAGCMASIEMSKNGNPTFLYVSAPIWKMVPVSVTHHSHLCESKKLPWNAYTATHEYTQYVWTVAWKPIFLQLEINNKSSFICVPAWSGCQIPVASFSQLVYHLEIYKG